MIVTCKATVTLEIYFFKKWYINIQYNNSTDLHSILVLQFDPICASCFLSSCSVLSFFLYFPLCAFTIFVMHISTPGGGGNSHTLPIQVCAAQRGRDFEAPYLERGIHFRGVF